MCPPLPRMGRNNTQKAPQIVPLTSETMFTTSRYIIGFLFEETKWQQLQVMDFSSTVIAGHRKSFMHFCTKCCTAKLDLCRLEYLLQNMHATNKLLLFGDFNIWFGKDNDPSRRMIEKHGVGLVNSKGSLWLKKCVKNQDNVPVGW